MAKFCVVESVVAKTSIMEVQFEDIAARGHNAVTLYVDLSSAFSSVHKSLISDISETKLQMKEHALGYGLDPLLIDETLEEYCDQTFWGNDDIGQHLRCLHTDTLCNMWSSLEGVEGVIDMKTGRCWRT